MKRNDIEMTEELASFLSFDLGHMNEDRFQNKKLDIKYSHKDLYLDIYYPEVKKEKYPVFLIVFGGGWVSGFKRSRFVEMMLKPLDYGYACVVADYTLALDGQFPEPIQDLKNVIGWIKENAEDMHLEKENITLWGESAGGHLGLCTVLMKDSEFELDYAHSSSVNQMVIFYPLVNIETVDRQMEEMGTQGLKHLREDSVYGIFMGNLIHDRAALKRSSPIHHLHSTMPKIWIQHGTKDDILPYAQTVELSEKIRSAFPNTILFSEICEGKTHTDSYFFSDENVDRIMEFIK